MTCGRCRSFAYIFYALYNQQVTHFCLGRSARQNRKHSGNNVRRKQTKRGSSERKRKRQQKHYSGKKMKNGEKKKKFEESVSAKKKMNVKNSERSKDSRLSCELKELALSARGKTKNGEDENVIEKKVATLEVVRLGQVSIEEKQATLATPTLNVVVDGVPHTIELVTVKNSKRVMEPRMY